MDIPTDICILVPNRTTEGSRMYLVTKRFTDGTLKGLAIQERTTVPFRVGETIPAGAWTGPGYVVEAVKEIGR